MENLYEILGSLLAVVVVTFLAPKARDWLAANATDAAEAVVLRMVRSFCRAAEQLLKEDDPTGEKRRDYVLNQLRMAGVEITEGVIAILEGEVWSINNGGKEGNHG